MRRRRTARLALLLIALLCLIGPSLAPYNPLDDVGESLAPPSRDHPFGTDLIGRDVLSRVLHGGRRTLGTAALAILIAIVPGLLVGLSVGYVGGAADRAALILIDAVSAVPSLLIALCVVALLGGGPTQIAVAVGIAGIPVYTRLARGAARGLRGALYIEAARAAGAGRLYILWRCILPNAAPTLISGGTVLLAWSLLNAATLYFLGFGGDPALPEWGAMLAEARSVLRAAPHVALAPGAALMGTLASVIAAGDAPTNPC